MSKSYSIIYAPQAFLDKSCLSRLRCLCENGTMPLGTTISLGASMCGISNFPSKNAVSIKETLKPSSTSVSILGISILKKILGVLYAKIYVISLSLFRKFCHQAFITFDYFSTSCLFSQIIDNLANPYKFICCTLTFQICDC